MLTIAAVVVVVVVGASLAYAKWQSDRQMEAWEEIDKANAGEDASKAVDELGAVAAQNITPALTEAALLKVAETAMREKTLPAAEPKDATTSAPAGKPVDWAAKAQEAYQEILSRFPDDKIAAGQAIIALGVLAEDQGNMEKARELYKKIADDKSYLHTALVGQADYRLAHLEQWSKPVVFPPPLMTVPIPEGTEAEAYTIPKEPASAQPAGGTTPAAAAPAQPPAPANPSPPGAQAPASSPPPAPGAQPGSSQ